MIETIYEPLRQVAISCGDPKVSSAVAIWVTGNPAHDGLGFIHCITNDPDRLAIIKTLREHADALERRSPTILAKEGGLAPRPGDYRIGDEAWHEAFTQPAPDYRPADPGDTSEHIASIAARLMHHEDPDVRAVAASALVQR